MPQMAPLNWLTLFLFFLIAYLMFNITNYYNFIYLSKKIDSKKKEIFFNWKW